MKEILDNGDVRVICRHIYNCIIINKPSQKVYSRSICYNNDKKLCNNGILTYSWVDYLKFGCKWHD